MSTIEIILGSINRIADSHFIIKTLLVNTLKKQILIPPHNMHFLNANNYYEYWVNSYNEKFYDMGTFIRLGTEIESGLKNYYMSRKGYSTLTELNADPGYSQGIFQRILPWQTNESGVMYLFNTELGYDLNSNPTFTIMQEIMVSRHLYAHSSGIINTKFVSDYFKITGIDVTKLPNIAPFYPNEDCYFFDPLKKLGEFINCTRRFFKAFP